MEADGCFHALKEKPDDACDKKGLTLPAIFYPHKDDNDVPVGCSVSGGYVYRAAPSLAFAELTFSATTVQVLSGAPPGPTVPHHQRRI